jgi:hypothetical protein
MGADWDIRQRASLLPAPLLRALIDVALPLLEGAEQREYLHTKHLAMGKHVFALSLMDVTEVYEDQGT